MRKFKNMRIAMLSILVTAASCSTVDFGGLNDNNNGAITPSTAGLLAGSIMTWGTFTNRTGVTIPTLLVQYQSQITYTDEMLYAQTPYSWNTYYQGVMEPLSKIIEICSATDLPTSVLNNGDPVNQIGTAMILRAMAIKRVTDIYGDAPYSQAFKGIAGITPAYDDQETLYKAIIADLKAGRDMLDATKKTVSGDIIYNGSVASWKRLANSVILQAALQLSKAYPNSTDYPAVEFNAALSHAAGVITTVAQEAWFSYEDWTGFQNPWFLNRTSDYRMSAEFINALNGCTTCPTVSGVSTVNPTSTTYPDDRKKIFVRGNQQSLNGVPYGYGGLSGSSRASMSTTYYWVATGKLPIMTSSYTFLNRAEAAEIGWTAEDPQAMLQSGMEKSFESLLAKAQAENPAASTLTLDESGYVSARLAQVGVSATRLQVIGEEKWKSLFGQAYDAWAEWRRTDVPTLVPATDATNGGIIPTRYIYPSNEASLNGPNYKTAVSHLSSGEDTNYAKIWWDK